MIIQIRNEETATIELCLLEFQGELVGELEGKELGNIEVKKVFSLRKLLTIHRFNPMYLLGWC